MAFAPVASGDLIQAETINNIVSGAVWFSTGSGSANSYSVTFDGVTGNNKNKITAPLTAGLLISFTCTSNQYRTFHSGCGWPIWGGGSHTLHKEVQRS